MKLYSDIPARRLVQVASDVGIVLWVTLWVRVAGRVHDTTMELAQPGRDLAGAGSSFRGTMTSAGDGVDNLPLLGDRVATPFRSASGVGTEIEQAGTALVSAVEQLSLLLALTTALVPILIVGLFWFARGFAFRLMEQLGILPRAPGERRSALHRRRPRPRPVRPACHGQAADAAAGRRLRRPRRGVASR